MDRSARSMAVPVLLFALAAGASPQKRPVFTEPTVHVTAIDVVADVRDTKGRVPPDLKPEDFVLIEDGTERKVIGVEYLRAQRSPAPAPAAGAAPPAEQPQWQIVVYFDAYLSNGRNLSQAAEILLHQVNDLVRKGTVDIVVASPIPTPLLRGSRDEIAVAKVLKGVMKRNATNALARHRAEFRSTVLFESALRTVEASRVRPYIEEEIVLIRQFRSQLTHWLSQYGKHVPRALFVVTDGFDLDPLDFYLANLDRATEAELRTYVEGSELHQSMERLSQTIAAGGWTTVSVLGNPSSGGWVNDASVWGTGRVRAFATPTLPPNGPKALLYAPQQPLQVMADATGGSVVSNLSRLDDAIRALNDRIVLTYQVARPPDGAIRKLEIRSRRSGVNVRSVQWSATATPNEIAAARALDVMVQGSANGDLKVTGSFDWERDARVGIMHLAVPTDPLKSALPAHGSATFLVTIAMQVAPKRALIFHRLVAQDDVVDQPFKYRVRLDVPPEAVAIIAVVEETTSGMWGVTRIPLQPPATR